LANSTIIIVEVIPTNNVNEDHRFEVMDTSREKDVAANPETQAFMKAKRAKGFH